jgi:hypothetical protein
MIHLYPRLCNALYSPTIPYHQIVQNIYPIKANATAATPNPQTLLPVITGTPAVLVLVDFEDVLCEFPDPLDVPPDVFALVFEVSVACEPVLVVEATTPPEVLVTASPAVIITGIYGWSVPVYVSVLIPGSFAS